MLWDKPGSDNSAGNETRSILMQLITASALSPRERQQQTTLIVEGLTGQGTVGIQLFNYQKQIVCWQALFHPLLADARTIPDQFACFAARSKNQKASLHEDFSERKRFAGMLTQLQLSLQMPNLVTSSGLMCQE